MSKLILEPDAPDSRRLFRGLKEKAGGFVEPVYQECLELELASQGH